MEEPQIASDILQEPLINKEQDAPNKERTSSTENSEYDSVESYSDEEEEEEEVIIKVRSKASGLDSHSENEQEEEEGNVILEREEGDGQESVPQKKVDDDEDKKNPQYIPKRGTFYEHDDRTAEDSSSIEKKAETEQAEKPEKEGGKKKIWQDKKERWTHDRFDNQEQLPKTRSELVSIYGYDIRNEDGPPRARRRRRYGRGPNKYTRNWEDEEAYTNNKAAVPPHQSTRNFSKNPNNNNNNNRNHPARKRNTEEFPPLIGAKTEAATVAATAAAAPISINFPKKDEKIIQKVEKLPKQIVKQEHSPVSMKITSEQINNHEISAAAAGSSSSRSNSAVPIIRAGTGRTVKPKKEIKYSDYGGFTAISRNRHQYGPLSSSSSTNRDNHQQNRVVMPNKKDGDFIQSQNFTNKNVNYRPSIINDLEKDIGQLNIQDGVYKGNRNNISNNNNNNNNNRQLSVPPRLQQQQQQQQQQQNNIDQNNKGSKRYSSMRQRSLPESATPPSSALSSSAPPPPPPNNFSFYPNDYNSTAPPPATQQPIMGNPLAAAAAAANLVAANPAVSALVAANQASAAAVNALQVSPFLHHPANSAQAFLQAAPPPFITAPPPTQPAPFNFVTQAQSPFVQNFPGPFNAVTQPPELYQHQPPQGGIIYYSTDQQIMQRPAAVPTKRPKAAIPIVNPTDFNKEQIIIIKDSASTTENSVQLINQELSPPLSSSSNNNELLLIEHNNSNE